MSKRTKKFSTEFHRRDVVARWRASGLSQAEFCRKEGCLQWQLSAWKRQEESKQRQIQKSKQPPKSPQKSIEFAEATLASQPFHPTAQKLSEQATGESPIAEMVFAGGSLRIFRNIDRHSLHEILAVLREVAR